MQPLRSTFLYSRLKDNIVTVTVGSVEHPMIDVHYIEWVSPSRLSRVIREKHSIRAILLRCFRICEGDEVEAVYAYCNLHSLWKAE